MLVTLYQTTRHHILKYRTLTRFGILTAGFLKISRYVVSIGQQFTEDQKISRYVVSIGQQFLEDQMLRHVDRSAVS
jgi:hypothetical protein